MRKPRYTPSIYSIVNQTILPVYYNRERSILVMENDMMRQESDGTTTASGSIVEGGPCTGHPSAAMFQRLQELSGRKDTDVWPVLWVAQIGPVTYRVHWKCTWVTDDEFRYWEDKIKNIIDCHKPSKRIYVSWWPTTYDKAVLERLVEE